MRAVREGDGGRVEQDDGEEMSYDKADLEKKALAAIKKHKIKFLSHLAPFLSCSRSTFYELELDKSDKIKDAIEQNRVGAKVSALNKWEKSDNPTLQVAYYKLIADEDEADRLNGSKQKIENSGTQKIIVEFVKNDGNDQTDQN
jgi:hypothetical protein